MASIRDNLIRLDACPPAVTWASRRRNPQKAWAECQDGSWMLWLIGRCTTSAPWSDERKPLAAASVACARLALPIYETRYPGDDRVRRCLDVTEAWTRGEATVGELQAARSAAAAASAYAATDAAAATVEQNTLAQCADIVRLHFPAPPSYVLAEVTR